MKWNLWGHLEATWDVRAFEGSSQHAHNNIIIKKKGGVGTILRAPKDFEFPNKVRWVPNFTRFLEQPTQLNELSNLGVGSIGVVQD